MRVGIIAVGNIWFSPYLRIYTKILDENNVEYDIVYWNRDGSDMDQGIQFSKRLDNNWPRWKKLILFIQYVRFVKKTVIQRKYDKLIVFGPQIAILISRFLKKHFKNKYIFDYRDLSIEQYIFLKHRFKRILSNSCLNVISSPGFLQYLPAKYDYVISHNLDTDICRSELSKDLKQKPNSDTITVLTIGGIRDYSSNSEVIQNLSNKSNIQISFVGKGSCADALKSFADSIDCNNISFEGYYPKEREKDYILNCTFLNIFYPKIKSHSSALSNRFYNSLIYKRPMIVTSHSIQGDYAEKYNLGLSLDNCNDLATKMREWLQSNDFLLFCDRCNELLRVFLIEQNMFTKKVIQFLD